MDRRHSEWVKNNPERTRELRRESWARHREENLEKDRQRYANNKEQRNESGRKWRKENAEYLRDYERERRINNPLRSREATLKWYRANKEHHLEVGRKWRANNPEQNCAISARRRTKIKGGGGNYTADEFKALCEQYDNRCLACGRENVKLTADHVIPVSLGGSSYIENIQPLCGPCNSSKGTKTTDYRTKPGLLRFIQRKLF
jgi:5-methylcytosine-specific restriction endonuclease McrA